MQEVERKKVERKKMERLGHIGSGIAMLTLIESTVSVTTRHSDSAPIASEAAMALVKREEATGAGRLPKPAMPADRIMVQDPSRRGRITRDTGEFRSVRRHGGDCSASPHYIAASLSIR